jgi:hypothetical protein
VNWKQLVKLGRELPEVAEGTWYGTPSLQVRGKSFLRLKEDGKTVVFLLESVDEQEFLTEMRAEVFFITDHYRHYPAVLARLAKLKTEEARYRLEHAWRQRAPAKLVCVFDDAKLKPRSPATSESLPRRKRPRTN